jgi:hypothetical protein
MNFNSNTAKVLLGAAVVAGAVTAITQPASAISFSTGGMPILGKGEVSALSGVTTVDFDNSTPAGITYTGGGIVSGTTVGQHAAPWADGTNYLTLGGEGESSPVTIALSSLQSYFGMYWGSIDTYNDIAFYRGSNLLRSINGAEVRNPADGNQGPDGSAYVNFFAAGPDDYFDTIVLSSTQAAFESDNHAFSAAIPTPALLPGLIGLGLGVLRKRKAEAAAQAEA